MTNTDTHDALATLNQVKKLSEAGCDIVRLAVPDIESAETIKMLKESKINTPIVADIHFDYRIALKCAEYGVDKIRINPGNIGDVDRVKAVCNACQAKNIPIRIGVNSGSLEKSILEKYGSPCPEALCESAMYHLDLLRKFNFNNVVISIKASDVQSMIKASKLIAERCDCPLHLGVTEAGSEKFGVIKSAAGIGALLCEGIGDTIRVSLSDDPIEEIPVCKEILKNCNLYNNSPKLVSCPTCGRIQYDLIPIAKEMEKFLETLESNITVAIMGCAVNGPGEAREADIGIAGGKNEGLLFKKGEIVKKIPEEDIVETLKKEILEMIKK
jgi:(E)-4-hydroxy-3-methylbut-2-enyl-diphosphate synthase